jgi:hypothetical protein
MVDARDAAVVARAAIADVVARYAIAVDTRDNDLYRSCFWPDATFTSGDVVMTGELLLDPQQRAAHAPSRVMTGGAIGLDVVEASSHVCGMPSITVVGSTGTATTNCVAHLSGRRDGKAALLVRGLIYRDELIERVGEWRIRRRVHSCTWIRDVPVSDVR